VNADGIHASITAPLAYERDISHGELIGRRCVSSL